MAVVADWRRIGNRDTRKGLATLIVTLAGENRAPRCYEGAMDCQDALLRGPFHEWYEAWGAGQADRREVAERERRWHERYEVLAAQTLP